MADARYFKVVKSNPGHVLYHLLPEVKTTSMTLRKRSHSFVLPEKSTKLDESNFICGMLYRNVYWHLASCDFVFFVMFFFFWSIAC